jgi:hypothetical protein
VQLPVKGTATTEEVIDMLKKAGRENPEESYVVLFDDPNATDYGSKMNEDGEKEEVAFEYTSRILVRPGKLKKDLFITMARKVEKGTEHLGPSTDKYEKEMVDGWVGDNASFEFRTQRIEMGTFISSSKKGGWKPFHGKPPDKELPSLAPGLSQEEPPTPYTVVF